MRDFFHIRRQVVLTMIVSLIVQHITLYRTYQAGVVSSFQQRQPIGSAVHNLRHSVYRVASRRVGMPSTVFGQPPGRVRQYLTQHSSLLSVRVLYIRKNYSCSPQVVKRRRIENTQPCLIPAARLFMFLSQLRSLVETRTIWQDFRFLYQSHRRSIKTEISYKVQ